MKKIKDCITCKNIKKALLILIVLLIISFMLNASFEKAMRYVVHKLPPTLFWTYESITPVKDEYKVWDIISFTSETNSHIKMRLIWKDYLYCWLEDKERYLYISSAVKEKWYSMKEWVYWKTQNVEWYKLRYPGENCYIISEQIGLPYWEEIRQTYKSHWPFNIVK